MIELQYLHLLERCMVSPVIETRNANCHSTFGAFGTRSSGGFPCSDHQEDILSGVIEELAWFLRGLLMYRNSRTRVCTSGTRTQKPMIRKRWMQVVFMDSYGDTLEPIQRLSYWLYWSGCRPGQNLLQGLRDNPTSRRHIICGWSPGTPASLPPCHVLYQFYVHETTLHVQMYQKCRPIPWSAFQHGKHCSSHSSRCKRVWRNLNHEDYYWRCSYLRKPHERSQRAVGTYT